MAGGLAMVRGCRRSFCHRLVFLGAATGISRSVARITRALGAGPSATALLIFWLIRVRFTNAYKRMSMPRAGHVYSLGT